MKAVRVFLLVSSNTLHVLAKHICYIKFSLPLLTHKFAVPLLKGMLDIGDTALRAKSSADIHNLEHTALTGAEVSAKYPGK